MAKDVRVFRDGPDKWIKKGDKGMFQFKPPTARKRPSQLTRLPGFVDSKDRAGFTFFVGDKSIKLEIPDLGDLKYATDRVADFFGDVGDSIGDAAREFSRDAERLLDSFLDPGNASMLARLGVNAPAVYADMLADLLAGWTKDLSGPPLPTPGLPPGTGFDKWPTRTMWDDYLALGGASTNRAINTHRCWMERRRYVDHRQQHEGWAVASGIHPWYTYLSTEGGNSYFSYWTYNPDTGGWELRICTVGIVQDEFWLNWDWGGNPPDESDLTAGQYMITWATWAVYFLTHGGLDGGASWPDQTLRQIPCQLGDHKDAGLDLTGRSGQPAGVNNPYGPPGCLRPPDDLEPPPFDMSTLPDSFNGWVVPEGVRLVFWLTYWYQQYPGDTPRWQTIAVGIQVVAGDVITASKDIMHVDYVFPRQIFGVIFHEQTIENYEDEPRALLVIDFDTGAERYYT